MEQSDLSRLAEELAPLAAQGTPAAAERIGRRIREEAQRLGLAPWTLTHMVGGEWERTGAVAPGSELSRALQ